MTSNYSPDGDLRGRVALVTGASSGIGRAAAVGLAGRGAHVALVGRDPERLRAATERVRAAGGPAPTWYRADFTRLADVRELADRVRADHPRIDLLLNNAGGLSVKRTVTTDGFETSIQTNHLAGFLLTQLLRDQLRGGRILMTSSDSYTEGDLDPADLNDEARPFKAHRAYGNSKQAQILTAAEATRRWPDVFAASFHPGQVRTRFASGTMAGIFFKFAPFLRTPERGADTLLWLATTPREQLVPGGYYLDRKLRPLAANAADPELAARLWDASLAAVGLPVDTAVPTQAIPTQAVPTQWRGQHR